MGNKMKLKRWFTLSVPASAALLLALLAASSAAAQTESILHRFNPSANDGSIPQSGLVADKAGNLYGTTYTGGTEDWGTIYELSPPATAGGSWTETILHNFTNGSDGATPLGNMTFDKNGNLFGTTTYGFLRGNVKCWDGVSHCAVTASWS
jgi:uncharacterized repeat protein (TIGR03803 family)